jgi:hypothetical protein
MNLTNNGVRRLLRAPTSDAALPMQDNGELSSQHHTCLPLSDRLAIARAQSFKLEALLTRDRTRTAAEIWAKVGDVVMR